MLLIRAFVTAFTTYSRIPMPQVPWSEENRRMLETLESWQQTPDSDEALETLPALSLADADVAPDWTETEETLTDGIRTLVHRISCNGVVHIRAYFNLTDCSLEDLSTAAGLSGLLGRMAVPVLLQLLLNLLLI